MNFFKDKYNAAGAFFLFLGILVIARNVLTAEYAAFFWYCDFVTFLFAAGFFLKDVQFVKGLVNIGLFSQLVTLFCLATAALFGWDLLGSSAQMGYSRFHIAISFIIHMFSTNIALMMTYRIKPAKKSLVYSAACLIVMLVTTLAFTPPATNVNFVFYNTYLSSIGFTAPYYTYSWGILVFGLVVMPTHFFQQIVYRKTSKAHLIKE
jgi:hypothetical protein